MNKLEQWRFLADRKHEYRTVTARMFATALSEACDEIEKLAASHVASLRSNSDTIAELWRERDEARAEADRNQRLLSALVALVEREASKEVA